MIVIITTPEEIAKAAPSLIALFDSQGQAALDAALAARFTRPTTQPTTTPNDTASGTEAEEPKE